MVVQISALPFILAGGAFLVGSIPVGYLLARAKGVDIRAHGSGNIGATNVGRVLGKRLGILCFVLDALKGFTPVVIAALLLHINNDPTRMLDGATAWAWLAAAAATILGHVFTPWLGFKGGKGVATGLGALLGVVPLFTLPVLVAAGVWFGALRVWRYVSLSSILAAASLPPMVLLIGGVLLRTDRLGVYSTQPVSRLVGALMPYLVVATLLALLVIVRHRGNIKRLRDGSEPKVGWVGKAAGRRP